MTKNSLTDLSWVDNAIKELKSDPPSVLDEVSHTIMKFNSMKPEEISDEYIHSVIDSLTYFFFMFPHCSYDHLTNMNTCFKFGNHIVF